MDFTQLISSDFFLKIVTTVLAVTVVLAARVLIDRAIIRRVKEPSLRRRWRASARTVAALILLLSLVAVWAEAIAAFALSLVAVAVATVVATKDLIECISGSILRLTADAYTVGDRVGIAGHRGDVVEYNVLTTTLREVDPSRASNQYTGQTIILPNSQLLRGPVINESTHGAFVLHTFAVPIHTLADLDRAAAILDSAAERACSGFAEKARAAWRRLAAGVDHDEIEPAVTVQVVNPQQLNLTVKLVVPIGRQIEIEQVIVRQFLREFDRSAGLPAPQFH